MRLGTRRIVLLFASAVLLACAPARSPAADPTAGQAGAGVPTGQARTLTVAIHYEPPVLYPKRVENTGRFNDTVRLFNGALALLDATGQPRPYLAQTLPVLNSPNWQVFADGRMETIYPLRPGLQWHDGEPLSADDFVFAWQLMAMPGQGLFFTTPFDLMETVLAPDPHTVLIRWHAPYPEAGALSLDGLPPLPRHVLERPFQTFEQDGASRREALANLPYWAGEYLGTGPYRLERWEPGSLLEGTAFEGHALGRPRIDRLIARIIPDENAVFANLLAGEVQLAIRNAIRFEHGVLLKRNWSEGSSNSEGSGSGGSVISLAGGTNATIFQLRPEYLKVPELLDLRVRRALAHGVDPDALNEGVFDGQGLMSETYVAPEVAYAAELDRAIAKYPYDPRRSEQLMNEAGLPKGSDGFYRRMLGATTGERIAFPYLVIGGGEYQQQGAILTDTWRRGGFDVQTAVVPATVGQDSSSRHTFPALQHNPFGIGKLAAVAFTSGQVGTPANNWGGINRGGWSSPEYDRLYEGYMSTLNGTARDRQMMQMMVVLSQTLPAIQTYLRFATVAHLSALRGPGAVSPDTMSTWNIHEWQLS
jgi:peptide/nickel transport system substrate-binding protein